MSLKELFFDVKRDVKHLSVGNFYDYDVFNGYSGGMRSGDSAIFWYQLKDTKAYVYTSRHQSGYWRVDDILEEKELKTLELMILR